MKEFYALKNQTHIRFDSFAFNTYFLQIKVQNIKFSKVKLKYRANFNLDLTPSLCVI